MRAELHLGQYCESDAEGAPIKQHNAASGMALDCQRSHILLVCGCAACQKGTRQYDLQRKDLVASKYGASAATTTPLDLRHGCSAPTDTPGRHGVEL